MATKYLIQIQYANKDTWDTFFEAHDSMTEANLGMFRAQGIFPHNKFRVIPVKGKEQDAE